MSKENKIVTLDISIGELIDNAIQRAKKLCTAHLGGVTVQFEFDGVLIRVNYDSDVGLIKRDFRRQRGGYISEDVIGPYPKAMLSKQERASDKAIQDKREAESRIRADEAKKIASAQMDTCLAQLDEASQSESSLMVWMKEFAQLAYNIYSPESAFQTVYKKLKSLGYKAGEACGLEQSAYKQRPIMARYVIGQVMYCIASGRSPHPLTIKFVDDYFRLA